MKQWCGEITYIHPVEGAVCYDICHHDDGKPLSKEKRKFIHDSLDEWLDKSNGTGNFALNRGW